MLTYIKANCCSVYEILVYLNSYFISFFIVCEVGIGILKACNLTYSEHALMADAWNFALLSLVEVIRIYFGCNGNLTTKKIPAFISILLTFPSALGVIYFMIYQTYTLQFEYIWFACVLGFQSLELGVVTIFMYTVCNKYTFY